MTEERRSHWWQRRSTAASEGPAPAFDLVRRGYSREQVDAHLALPPEQRPRPAAFDLVRIGYDRAQVDRALREQG
ncbi:hypothetical protein [Kitasatospora cheerisanensis]|uniref:DivIVA domain-containing protein n=1 Tax=Kitasatospora cheerisanensis KCTC 2395 TaxID=1348663 RepID=A0A066YI03_9ACTN|nr:hypothetical protein [Kitasatospora cheerisanensis]KDN80762.1 hypothetical protein KCH_75420 [Kitasatospora cheerisanensis KCTC 2395]